MSYWIGLWLVEAVNIWQYMAEKGRVDELDGGNSKSLSESEVEAGWYTL